MTVKLMTSINTWIGLSTDTKPTVASATVPIGSRFYEYDTNLTYITYDGTNWVKYAYELTTVNISTSRDLPYLTEFWETESLNASVWGSTIDGAGTETFATSGGYMFYDMDTGAVADNDVMLYSNYRWVCAPSVFGDSNAIVQRLCLEWEAQITSAVAGHDNTNFFMGFSSAQTTDITQQNIIGFFLDSDALKGKCDKGGTETGGATSAITATLTNWNKFKITIDAASITFSLNGTDQTALTTAASQPDVAMYIVFGTRAEAGSAVGLNVGPVRCWYEEAI